MSFELFSKGQRVKTSKEWLTIPEGKPNGEKYREGFVSATSNTYWDMVSVRWDGLKSASRYHKDFLKKVNP